VKPSDIRRVVVEFLAPVGIDPCGDNSCVFGSPGGMGTNGGCQCVGERESGQRGEDRQTIMRLARAVNGLAKEVATLRHVQGRRFPIMGAPSVLWSFVAPHERQVKENHDQTLERLAERGGLSPSELWCAVNGERLRKQPAEAFALMWVRNVVADEQAIADRATRGTP
jgi:hypothetical protein